MDSLKAQAFLLPLSANWSLAPFKLPVRDAFAAVVFTGVAVHLIFHRWEPLHLAAVLSLLVVLPSSVSALLIPHYGIAKAIGLGLTIFYATLLFSIALYRSSPLHPLSRYPGPFPAKLTKFWHVWKILDGKQHLYLRRMHDKYGDVIRIGPNELSVRDANWITPVLGAQGMPKGPMFNGRHLWPETPSLIGFRDPEIHQRRRKPWNRAFNTASVKEFVPTIQNRVQQLVEALASREGQVVDLAQWIGFFTYDFMGDMVFGGWTEMLREGNDHNGLWALIKSGLRSAFIYEHLPWLSYYTKHLPGVGKDVKVMRAMGFTQTEKRITHGSSSKDLFYFLGNEDGKEQISPPKNVVISDGVLALIAGSDTTTTVLSSTFYSLLRNPEVYKRLQAEVDKFYPPGEDSLDPVHLPEMHYLSAVIMETMRMFPAVPSGSQRAPEPGKGGRMIGDSFVPEGTHTRIHFWSVHRDPRNFSYPDTYWPDRWLIADGMQEHHEAITHNSDAWLPFSFGPSNCVGKNLAMQEMRELLCHFLQKLSVRLPDGADPAQYEKEMEDRFVFSIGHLPVILERRD